MQAVIRLLVLLVALLLCRVSTAATILFEVQELGADLFHIDYRVSGLDVLQFQELELRFHPDVYRALSNPVIPTGFDAMLFQPNNPPGTVGRFSIMALLDYKAPITVFGLDVRTVEGVDAGAQEYAFNLLNQNGRIVAIIASGDTFAAVPEPSTLHLAGIAVIAAAAMALRRFRRQG